MSIIIFFIIIYIGTKDPVIAILIACSYILSLIQLNINSLSGQYGPGVKKMAAEMINRGYVDVIGSDCHHLGHLELIKGLRTNSYLHKVIKENDLLNFKL